METHLEAVLQMALEELRNIANADLPTFRKDFGEDANRQFLLWARNRARFTLEKAEQRLLSEHGGQPSSASGVSSPKKLLSNLLAFILNDGGSTEYNQGSEEACRIARCKIQPPASVEHQNEAEWRKHFASLNQEGKVLAFLAAVQKRSPSVEHVEQEKEKTLEEKEA